MSNKAIRNAMMTAKKYARRKFATDGFVDPTSNPLNKDDPSQWLNPGGIDNLDNMNKIGWANALLGTLSNPDKPEDFNPLETSYWALGGEIAPLTTAGVAAINMMTTPANEGEDEEARRYLYDPNYPQWRLDWAKHDLGLDNPQKRGGRIGYDSGGAPVKIDPVTGLPINQGNGGGPDNSSPSSPNSSTSSTGFGPIDNAIANPGQTATNIGAGIALGALGPIGMGISAANTVSGLLGGPTIGSTLVGPSEPSTPTNVGTVASYSNAPTSTTTSSTPSSSTSHAGMSDQLGADIQDTNAASAALMGDIQAGLNSSTTNSSSTPTSSVSSPSTSSTPMGLDQASNLIGTSFISDMPGIGPAQTGVFGLSGPVGSDVVSINTDQAAQQGHFGVEGIIGSNGLPTGSAQQAALESTFGPNSAEQSALDAVQAGINSASLAESPSSAPPDGTPPDGTPPDGTPPDGTPPDGTPPDGGTPDGGSPDGGSPGGDDDGHTGGRFTNPNRRPKAFRVKHNWNKHIEMMSQDDLKKEIRKALMTAKRGT